jgi:hypothetical protein
MYFSAGFLDRERKSFGYGQFFVSFVFVLLSFTVFFICFSLLYFLVVVAGLRLGGAQLLAVALVAVDVVLEGIALATLHAGVQDQTTILQSERGRERGLGLGLGSII